MSVRSKSLLHHLPCFHPTPRQKTPTESSLTDQCDSLSARLSAATRDNSTLRQQISVHRDTTAQSIHTLRQEKSSIEARLSSAADDNHALRRQNDSLTRAIEHLKEEGTRADNNLAEERRRMERLIAERDAGVSAVKAECERVRDEMRSVVAIREAAEGELRDAQLDKREAVERLSQLRTVLERERTEHADVLQQLVEGDARRRERKVDLCRALVLDIQAIAAQLRAVLKDASEQSPHSIATPRQSQQPTLASAEVEHDPDSDRVVTALTELRKQTDTAMAAILSSLPLPPPQTRPVASCQPVDRVDSDSQSSSAIAENAQAADRHFPPPPPPVSEEDDGDANDESHRMEEHVVPTDVSRLPHSAHAMPVVLDDSALQPRQSVLLEARVTDLEVEVAMLKVERDSDNREKIDIRRQIESAAAAIQEIEGRLGAGIGFSDKRQSGSQEESASSGSRGSGELDSDEVESQLEERVASLGRELLLLKVENADAPIDALPAYNLHGHAGPSAEAIRSSRGMVGDQADRPFSAPAALIMKGEPQASGSGGDVDVDVDVDVEDDKRPVTLDRELSNFTAEERMDEQEASERGNDLVTLPGASEDIGTGMDYGADVEIGGSDCVESGGAGDGFVGSGVEVEVCEEEEGEKGMCGRSNSTSSSSHTTFDVGSGLSGRGMQDPLETRDSDVVRKRLGEGDVMGCVGSLGRSDREMVKEFRTIEGNSANGARAVEGMQEMGVVEKAHLVWERRPEHEYIPLYVPRMAMTPIRALPESAYVVQGFCFQSLKKIAYARTEDGRTRLDFRMHLNAGFNGRGGRGEGGMVRYFGLDYPDGTTLMYVPVEDVGIEHRRNVATGYKVAVCEDSEEKVYGHNVVCISLCESVYEGLVGMAERTVVRSGEVKGAVQRPEEVRREGGRVWMEVSMKRESKVEAMCSGLKFEKSVADMLIDYGEDIYGRGLVYMMVSEGEGGARLGFRLHRLSWRG